MRSLGWVLIALVLLPGCKLFKSKNKDTIEPPAALVEFQPNLSVRTLWSSSVGQGVKRTGSSPRPVFASGRLFITDVKEGLLALDADSGKRIWRYQHAERMVSGAYANEEIVLAGTIDGLVVAVDASNGEERWNTRVSSELLAPPVVAGGVVVVRSNDGRLHGLALNDGGSLWQFDRGAPLISLRGNSAPVVVGDKVFIGYDNARVIALNAADGTLIWEQTVAQAEGRTELERMNDIDGEIQVVDDVLYAVSYRGQIAALAINNGRPLWSREMSSYSGISTSGSVIYCVDEEGVVWALDSRSGSSLWKQEALNHRWLTTPVTMGEYLVIGDIEGYVHWLKRDDGSFAARLRADKNAMRAAPLVIGNRVYLSSVEGKVAAFELN